MLNQFKLFDMNYLVYSITYFDMLNELFGIFNELFDMFDELFGIFNELFDMFDELFGIFNKSFGIINDFSDFFVDQQLFMKHFQSISHNPLIKMTLIHKRRS